jgi:DMSO reductase family type II enzyme heme b subunit
MSSILDVLQSDVTFEDLLVPAAAQWQDVPVEVVPLIPTPLDRQPSAYVQSSWAGKPRSNISAIEVQVLQTVDSLVIRLQWDADQPRRSIDDINAYADACAVMFPGNGVDADLQTMGSPDKPVIAWHWRAGAEEAFSITATGIGTVERNKDHRVKAQSRWAGGRWQVVIGRFLQGDDLNLASAKMLPIAFAVWNGSLSERAGLKSHSADFHHLRIN